MYKKLVVISMAFIVMLLYAKVPVYASTPTILGPEVTKYLSTRNDTVSIGVYDSYTGKSYTYNPSKKYKTASIVKMSMLADVLYKKTPITSYENSLLTRMIENSDNSAASAIWVQLGSDRNVQSFFRTAGMPNTIAGTGGWWGFTTTNVTDQLTMMKYFAYPNKLLTDSQRAYGLNLMRNVRSDQRWGTGYGLPAGVSIALKNGWSTTHEPNNWKVNSVGYINGKGKNYVIAVLSSNNKTLSYGIDTLNTINKMVWNEIPEHLPSIGAIDAPSNNTTAKGQSVVKGWFLDENGVSKVEVLVDGAVAGQAAYGDARADVLKAYPKYKNGKAGYHFTLDTSKFSDGKHTVTVKETGTNGRVTTLPGRTLTFANVKGVIDNPVSGATLRGTKNVSGWFLNENGVKKVEVLVDGRVAGEAIYGDARLDVLKAYPAYKNKNAGYHFALDTTKYSDGKHIITIKETGSNGRVTTLTGRSITFSNVKGYLESPGSGSTLKGTKNVSGWFLNISGVEKIEVLVDNTVAGQAFYGDSRADVLKVYPEFNNGKAGYHFALNTAKYSNGKHTIKIKETGKNGSTYTITCPIIFNNN